MNNPLLKLACRYVFYNLRKDKGFWESWKSNMAMTMYDVLKESIQLQKHEEKLWIKFCNDGAEKFLKLLTEI